MTEDELLQGSSGRRDPQDRDARAAGGDDYSRMLLREQFEEEEQRA